MQNVRRKSHDGISLLKGLSCIIVLLLHIPVPGVLGKIIDISCHFAVILFFMITGYFMCQKNTTQWVLKKIRQIISILLIAELVYGISDFLLDCIVYKTINAKEWLKSINLIKRPLKVLFFGTAFNGTLWFLYAMIYVYIIYLLLIKFHLLNNKWIYLAVPILYAFLVFGRLFYQNHFVLNDENVYLFRNFFLPGLPLTLMGSGIYFFKEKITTIKSISCLLIIGIGMVGMIIELLIYKALFLNWGMEYYINTVLLSLGIFILALKFDTIKIVICKPLIYLGEKLYMWVYLFHMLILYWIEVLAMRLGFSNYVLWTWIKPLVVLSLCCLCGIGIMQVSKRISSKNI